MKKIKTMASLMSAFFLMLTIPLACKAPPAAPPSTYAKKYSIGCIYSEIKGAFWGPAYNGCMKAINELAIYGIQAYCTAPANTSDYLLQAELIDDAIQKGVDGITLCPVNVDAIGAYIDENFTDGNGVPIFVIGCSLDTHSKWNMGQIISDTCSIGNECAKLAAQATGNKGKYLLYSLDPENPDLVSIGAIDYFQRSSHMTNAYDSGQYVLWNPESSLTENTQFLKDERASHPDVPLVIITINEQNTLSVALAAKELGESNIVIISAGFSQDIYDLLKGGELYGAIGQNPYLMGYKSVYVLIIYLEKGKFDIDTLIPGCVVTKATMETQEVKDYIRSLEIE